MPRNKKLPIQRFEAFFLMPTRLKYALVMLLDAGLMIAALWIAAALRWGSVHFIYGTPGWLTAFSTAALSLLIFSRMGFYRAVVRHMGQQAMLAIIRGITLSALICALGMVIFDTQLPRSTPFLYWSVALFLLGGSRLLVRAIFYLSQRNSGIPVAIYGAGASGRQLLSALTNGGEYAPVVFIDDDLSLVGRTIDGIPVFNSKNINSLVDDYAIRHVLLAMPVVAVSKSLMRWKYLMFRFRRCRVCQIWSPDDPVCRISKLSLSRIFSVVMQCRRICICCRPACITKWSW
jgi:FlaA1/EpsC-like NDP-sugar epimerase